MVESIGAKSVTETRPVARVAATTPVAAAPTVQEPAVNKTAESPSGVSGIARQLAASAPVDVDRVAQIKKAIANGSFPILPSTIADRLIALRLQWNPNDQA